MAVAIEAVGAALDAIRGLDSDAEFISSAVDEIGNVYGSSRDVEDIEDALREFSAAVRDDDDAWADAARKEAMSVAVWLARRRAPFQERRLREARDVSTHRKEVFAAAAPILAALGEDRLPSEDEALAVINRLFELFKKFARGKIAYVNNEREDWWWNVDSIRVSVTPRPGTTERSLGKILDDVTSVLKTMAVILSDVEKIVDRIDRDRAHMFR